MKKYVLDLKVVENLRLHENYYLLKLTADEALPEMEPGQFVEVRVDGSSSTFLRRPISINYIDRRTNQLWLLIQLVGEGTRQLANCQAGDRVNVMLPLGKGFSIPEDSSKKVLLIGGGVGVAPLLFLGDELKNRGIQPVFLLGARTNGDLMQLAEFEKRGTVYVTTEDGSMGQKGYVTNHLILQEESFDYIYTCGPKPMMVAVVRYASSKGIDCEVSLENTMACGIGACLCCVEPTRSGNICVCTEGPVFHMNQLTWLN